MPKNPKYNITKARRQRLEDLLMAEVSEAKIEKIMGISNDVLRRHYPEVFEKYPRTGGPSHFDPTPEQLRQIEVMAGLGMGIKETALVVGIPRSTLYKHCQDIFIAAKARMNMRVGANIYKMATGPTDDKNTVTAAIWWSKARMGWQETAKLETTNNTPTVVNQVQIFLPDNGRDDRNNGPVIDAQDHDDDEEAEGTTGCELIEYDPGSEYPDDIDE